MLIVTTFKNFLNPYKSKKSVKIKPAVNFAESNV